jgi:putative NIF3 family GTP cyclohydrolase 1 type 2
VARRDQIVAFADQLLDVAALPDLGSGLSCAARVTGGGGTRLVEAPHTRATTPSSREPEEPALHTARELGIHFLAGGHYATETFGVQALAARLSNEFALEWEFLDLPSPV